jgi:hypothetical protein
MRTAILCLVLLVLTLIRCWPAAQAAGPGPRIATASVPAVGQVVAVAPAPDPHLLAAQAFCAALPLIL